MLKGAPTNGAEMSLSWENEEIESFEILGPR